MGGLWSDDSLLAGHHRQLHYPAAGGSGVGDENPFRLTKRGLFCPFALASDPGNQFQYFIRR